MKLLAFFMFSQLVSYYFFLLYLVNFEFDYVNSWAVRRLKNNEAQEAQLAICIVCRTKLLGKKTYSQVASQGCNNIVLYLTHKQACETVKG